MKLYFVACQGAGMNLDWFVIAETPEEAFDLWLASETVAEETDGEKTKFKIFDTRMSAEGPARVLSWYDDVPVTLEGIIK